MCVGIRIRSDHHGSSACDRVRNFPLSQECNEEIKELSLLAHSTGVCALELRWPRNRLERFEIVVPGCTATTIGGFAHLEVSIEIVLIAIFRAAFAIL